METGSKSLMIQKIQIQANNDVHNTPYSSPILTSVNSTIQEDSLHHHTQAISIMRYLASSPPQICTGTLLDSNNQELEGLMELIKNGCFQRQNMENERYIQIDRLLAIERITSYYTQTVKGKERGQIR